MNKFGELLYKYNSIVESISKQSALEEIQGFSKVIGTHILKILLFKDEYSYKKHCIDLDGFIDQCIDAYEDSKVKPSKNEIVRVLLSRWDSIYNIKRRISSNNLSKYTVPKTSLYSDLNKTKTYLYEILDIISNWIVNKTRPDMISIMDKYIKDLK